jgi:RNA polymerase sigma-B factor
MAPPVSAARSMSPDDVAQIFDRYARTHVQTDRELLMLRFLPLARYCARRYEARGEREDLEQVASLALLKAIDRFDPDRGIAFTSFAMPTMMGELKRHFRDHGWMVKVPRPLQELRATVTKAVEELAFSLGRTPTVHELARHCDVSAEQIVEVQTLATAHRPESLDRPLGDEEIHPVLKALGHDDPEYERVERARDLKALLSLLPEREREILRLRFTEDLRQNEIAERIGISQMHVSRLIRKAIATLQLAARSEAPPVEPGSA